MAEICCGVVSDGEASAPCKSSPRAARRRRMEIRGIKFASSSETETEEQPEKRQKVEVHAGSASRLCDNGVHNSAEDGEKLRETEKVASRTKEIKKAVKPAIVLAPIVNPELLSSLIAREKYPRFGVASICGRRRDMEDAVAIHLSFCRPEHEIGSRFHYFGVYDGHGCSHVATKCRDRLHELVKEEVESKEAATMEWKNAMERSFYRMDKELISWNESVVGANCRCELQTPECDAVGSTAVVAIVTPDKIIVANCGDSRAVLCRNGKPIPLSTDHKPDRPDELNRILAAGGRVIYWEGPRVCGVLAMSRAIGDNYLKPYVICEPEVTVMERTAGDDCLILASDGLWDVVSNETACGVARMCLRGKSPPSAAAVVPLPPESDGCRENADKACSDASMLLTKLALARRSTDNVSVVVVDLRSDT